jgi:branched-chain amino acid transport system ATP-binding protein
VTVTLAASGIVKRHGPTTVVDSVDLTVSAGCIAVIVGPNGAGKTTFFNCISGVDPPDAGSVVHRARDVTGWTSDEMARRGVARTFQHSSVFSSLTVADNLLVAAEHHGSRTRRRTKDSAASATVRRVLRDLDLTKVAHERAGGLPSGTKSLVEVGRALCTQPDTLLLDEPASGLDDAETRRLHHLLRRLSGEGLALLMVEHDLELVARSADEVHVMSAGRVVASGAPADVLNRTDVRELLSVLR